MITINTSVPYDGDLERAWPTIAAAVREEIDTLKAVGKKPVTKGFVIREDIDQGVVAISIAGR